MSDNLHESFHRSNSGQNGARNGVARRHISDLNCENIPPALTQYPQWVVYKLSDVNAHGKRDKVPLNPSTGWAAKVNDPTTWSTFEEAVAAYLKGVGDGLGFVFTAQDPYVGIDLDGCRDPRTGQLAPWADVIVQRLNSYTETSPSETGVHIIGVGKLPGGGTKEGGVEMYETGRFFTVTGQQIGGTPTTIEARHEQIAALYHEHLSHKTNGNGAHKEAKPHATLSEKERQQILAELRLALPFIPAVAHDTWLETGMGVHHVDSGTVGYDLWVEWSKRCPEKFDFDDCEKRWRSFHDDGGLTHRSIFARAIEHGWKAAPDSFTDDGREQEPTADLFRCTDLGNGERLIARYGHNLLYNNEAKKFLTWNERRWEVDNIQQVRQWARHTVRGLYSEVQRLTEQAKNEEVEDKKQAPATRAAVLLRHAVKSEAEPRVKAMLNLAQMDCPVSQAQLDANLWALNCLNGTLDLRTGTLQPHLRADRITKLVPIAYDAAAVCPTWETFLSDIMAVDRETGTNADLVDFLQKAIGYSLTGDCREDCLIVLYGLGRNGKTTLLETVRAVCGDYATQAAFSTFLHKDRDGVRNDVADLRGARFVSAIEADKDKKLSEALIKQLTGRDTVKARFLFQEHFEFKPQLKLWLGTNYKPVIQGTDDGIWRRIRLVPFTMKFEGTNDDKTLGERLRGELPGILAWAVRGCLAWQKEGGLPFPDAVKAATGEYRNEMDVLGNFLTDCCELKPHLRVKAGDLYNAYVKWSGDKYMNQTVFGRMLNDRGITREKSGPYVWRLGLALTTEEPQ